LPSTTYYGDLGVDLAKRIVHSAIITNKFKDDLENYLPSQLGRATVYGLALSNTEVSGTTLFISNPKILPLNDIPIVGKISLEKEPVELNEMLEIALNNSNGGCFQIELIDSSLKEIKSIGEKISVLLKEKNYQLMIKNK